MESAFLQIHKITYGNKQHPLKENTIPLFLFGFVWHNQYITIIQLVATVNLKNPECNLGKSEEVRGKK